MKRARLLVVLVVIVAVQATFLSSFRSININTYTTGSYSAVIISKANYVFLRVQIDIYPHIFQGQSQTVLLFPNGTQTGISSFFRISVIMPITGYSLESFMVESRGINISNDHPIDAEVISNVTSDFLSFGFSSNEASAYSFIIQGYARIIITGYGVAV